MNFLANYQTVEANRHQCSEASLLFTMICDKIGVEGCALEQATVENPDGIGFAGHCGQASALCKPLRKGVLPASTS
jgi:hypothetical protein